MIEEYRKIEGSAYSVSNLGNVKTSKGLVLKPRLHRTGYYTVGIDKKTSVIHRAVGKAFVPNPNNYPDLNHLDGNKLNNEATNLQWCTKKQNIHHAYAMGLSSVGEKRYNSKLTASQVLEIRALSGVKNHRQIAEIYNISHQSVWGIINNKKWKHIKYHNK